MFFGLSPEALVGLVPLAPLVSIRQSVCDARVLLLAWEVCLCVFIMLLLGVCLWFSCASSWAGKVCVFVMKITPLLPVVYIIYCIPASLLLFHVFPHFGLVS